MGWMPSSGADTVLITRKSINYCSWGILQKLQDIEYWNFWVLCCCKSWKRIKRRTIYKLTKDKIPYQDAHWYRWFEIWSITRSPYHDMISQPYQNTDLINDTTITRSLHDMVTRRSNTHWACHPRPVPVLMCTLWYKRVFLLVHRFASDHQIVKKRRNDHCVTELIIISLFLTPIIIIRKEIVRKQSSIFR